MLPQVLAIPVALNWIGLFFWFFVYNFIEGEFEGVIDHPRNDLFEVGTGALQTRILIDLNEPYFKLAIDDEV